MKRITLTLCALCLAAFSFGQSIDKNKVQVNAGIGLSSWGLPVYLGADYWVTDEVTIGVEASCRYRLLHTYHYGYFGASANGNFHFNKILQLPDNIDFYVGVSAGPYFGFGDYFDTYDSFDFGVSAQVGGRYKINDQMWLQGEVGGGSLSGAKIGVTFKL